MGNTALLLAIVLRWFGELNRCLHCEIYAVLTASLQVEVGQGKKAVIVFVPVPLLQSFHKIQQRYATFPHQNQPKRNRSQTAN